MRRYSIHKYNILKLLLLLAIFELIAFGSGQVANIGFGLTLRMVFFIIIFLMLPFIIQKTKFTFYDLLVFSGFIILTCISTSIALINNNNLDYLFLDIKQLIFFLEFIFFIYIINNNKICNQITKIIKWTTLGMAIIYIIYLILIKSLFKIDFLQFYRSMSDESDFMFRGDGGEFFYKGFVFLPIGFLFWLNERKYFYCFILLISIFFTLTRGFYIMTFIGVIWLLFSRTKDSRIKIFLPLCFILAFLAIYFTGIFDQGEDRSHGDVMRIVMIEQVIDQINVLNFFIGNGFGKGIDFRPIHMENSFLEILFKQGIIGILFWLFVLFVIIKRGLKLNKYSNNYIYMVGTVMIYVQSLFNPYITNSMGLGFTIISYCIIKQGLCSNENKNSSSYCNI